MCGWIKELEGLEKYRGDPNRSNGKGVTGMMRCLVEVKLLWGGDSGVMGAGRTLFTLNVSFLVSILESRRPRK